MIHFPLNGIGSTSGGRDAQMRLTTAFGLAAIVAVAVATGSGAPAQAQIFGIHEFKAGLLLHDVPDLWSGFSLEHRYIDINAEVSFAGVPFLGGTLRPVIGGTVSSHGDTSHAYADARWQFELPLNLFLATGVGVAVHDGYIEPTEEHRKALGSRALFHIPFEIGYRLDPHNSVSFYFEHTSNAGLANYNEGLDRMGLRYGYRF